MAVARMTDEEYIQKYGAPPLPARPIAPPMQPKKPLTVGQAIGGAAARGVTAAEQGTETAGQALQRATDEAYQIGQQMKGSYREARGLPPEATPKAASPVTQTSPVARAQTASNLPEGFTKTQTASTEYLSPKGTMTSESYGAAEPGTFNVVSGPGRGSMAQKQWDALPNEERIARNVASYEGQTQAIRDARNAGRVARGERPVGERASEEVLVMGEAPKETDQIRTERLLKDMVTEGTPKDRRTAIELLATMGGPTRPGKTEEPSFADQLGVARFGLDTAKAEADALQATRQNQVASAREERENMLANLQLNKADKEMMRERVTEIENSSLGSYGLPAEMLAGMERGLAKQLPNVDEASIAANIQMELAEMRKNGNLPKKPDLADIDQATLMKKVYDRIQRAQEKEE